MTAYVIAANDWTTYYDVHKPGCRHLIHPKFTSQFTVDAATAKAAAADFEAADEGCLTTLGPCVRKET